VKQGSQKDIARGRLRIRSQIRLRRGRNPFKLDGMPWQCRKLFHRFAGNRGPAGGALLLLALGGLALQSPVVRSAPAKSLSAGKTSKSPRKKSKSPTIASPSPAPAPKASPSYGPAPLISSLARSEVLARVLGQREVMTHADLQDFEKGTEMFPGIRPVLLPTPPGKSWLGGTGAKAAPSREEVPLEAYDFYVGVLVKAGLKRTREVLTNYKVYSELVPYVSRTQYFPVTKTLQIEGGIWRYRINSRVRFEERGEGWIRFKIISGHFRGMVGEILLEPVGEEGRDGMLVFMRGQSIANRFPPAFVIEQGAQVVFGFTANRIRSYIESGKVPPPAEDSSPVISFQASPTPSPGPRETQGAKPDDTDIPRPVRKFK